MSGKEGELPELGRGERQERAGSRRLTGVLVDDEVEDLHHRLPRVPGTSQYRPDPGQKLGHHEGLDQVVISTGIEPVQAIGGP